MLLVIYIVSEKRVRQAVVLWCFLHLAKFSSIATMFKDEIQIMNLYKVVVFRLTDLCLVLISRI